MAQFIRLFVNKQNQQLSESQIPYDTLLETTSDLVYEFHFDRDLSKTQSDNYAEAISDFLLENGIEDFSIEISISEAESNAIMERRIQRQIAENWKTKVQPVLEAHPGTHYMGAYVYSKEAEQAILEHKQFVEAAKKKKNPRDMPCNKPKAEKKGGKSHVVKACDGDKQEVIRFGQAGVKGSPDGSKRNKAFKARHGKNIKKGKMSAAYWANKVKW